MKPLSSCLKKSSDIPMRKLSARTMAEITKLAKHYLANEGSITDPKFSSGTQVKPEYAPFVHLFDMITNFGGRKPKRF